MQEQYAVLTCRDILTDTTYIDKNPRLLSLVKEDLLICRTHNDLLKEFSLIITATSDTNRNEFFQYPHPTRNTPWKLTLKIIQSERKRTEDIIDNISDHLYMNVKPGKRNYTKFTGPYPIVVLSTNFLITAHALICPLSEIGF